MPMPGVIPQHDILTVDRFAVEIVVQVHGIAISARSGPAVIYFGAAITQRPHIRDRPTIGDAIICSGDDFVTAPGRLVAHTPFTASGRTVQATGFGRES